MVNELIEEDKRRVSVIRAPYEPIKGINAVGERKHVHIPDLYPYDMYLPIQMLEVKLVKEILKCGCIDLFCQSRYGNYSSQLREMVVRQFYKIRAKHDFCFCAYAFYKIKNKEGGKNIPFKLTYPQRYLLGVLEEMRLQGEPIRIILLKARQWGGSTLVQLYISWIQLFWKEGWYSVIVAQDASTSRKIKAMYSKMLEVFPPWLIDCPEDVELAFTPYEGSQLDSIITYGKEQTSLLQETRLVPSVHTTTLPPDVVVICRAYTIRKLAFGKIRTERHRKTLYVPFHPLSFLLLLPLK